MEVLHVLKLTSFISNMTVNIMESVHSGGASFSSAVSANLHGMSTTDNNDRIGSYSKEQVTLDRLDAKSTSKSPRARSIICRFCGKILCTRKGLLYHERKHTGELQSAHCATCDRTFADEINLKIHQREVHSGGQINYHSCPVCNKKFVRRRNLVEHMNRKLHEIVELPKTIKVSKKKKDQLANNNIEIPTKERKYPCDKCEKSFFTQHNLNNHQRVHSDERPFRCTHCSLAFRSKGNLKEHLESHMNILKYKSKYCEHGFRSIQGWRSHNKIHEETGLCKFLPYRLKHCNICSEPIATEFLLKTHLQEKHPGEPCLSTLSSHTPSDKIEQQSKKDRLPNSVTEKPLSHLANVPSTAIIVKTEQEQEGSTQVHSDDFDFELKEFSCQEFQSTDHHLNFMENLSVMSTHDRSTPFHDKSLAVSLTKMLFKPMIKKRYRTLTVIKPSTISPSCVPWVWFLCSKCGRAFSQIAGASSHKNTCPHKGKFKSKNKEFLLQPGKSSSATRETLSASIKSGLSEDNEIVHRISNLLPAESNVVDCEKLLTPNDDAADPSIATLPLAPGKDISYGPWRESWTENLAKLQELHNDPRVKPFDDRKFQCTICARIFQSKTAAKRHCRRHDEKKFKCEACNVSFHFELDFKGHVRRHTGEKPYPCRICGKSFRLPCLRYTHEQSHLPPDQRKMKRKTYKRRTHQATPISLLCDKCSKTFTTTFGLKIHMKQIHPVDGIKPKPFSCTICLKRFTSGSHMRTHVRNVHKHVISSEQLLTADKAISDTSA